MDCSQKELTTHNPSAAAYLRREQFQSIGLGGCAEPSMDLSAVLEHSSRRSTGTHTSSTDATLMNSSTDVISPPSKDRKSNKSCDDLTLNKLQFKSLGIHGRDDEIDVLQQCLERLISGNKKQLVFISGESGSGKSILAASLTDRVQQIKGVHVRGKFEPSQRRKPGSGMLSIAKGVCREIEKLKRRNRTKFSQLCEELQEALGDALPDLMRAFPVLYGVLFGDDDNDDDDDDDTDTKVLDSSSITTAGTSNTVNISKVAKSAFNQAHTIFVRVLCKYIHPMIMNFDDLQWAEASSLELIDKLCHDVDNNNLMMIAVYRSNEVDETHLLAKIKRDLVAAKDTIPCEVTEISLGPLPVHAVNQVVQTLLRTDDDVKTLPLAELCHKKCGGNPHHLVEFMRSLEERSLVEYHFGLMEWTWDMNQITTLTQASDNVVDLLKGQMMKQSALVQRTLALAAFLDFTFAESSLWLVCRSLSTGEDDGESLTQRELKDALAECEAVGFIEASGECTFSWVHDAIQEAALSITSDRASLSGRIGEVLSVHLSEADLEDSIFTVVNLLNTDSTFVEGDPERSIEVSKLNLRASQRAVGFAAFESAAGFLDHAIRCLPASKWKSHYELTLELYSLRAEVAVVTGQSEHLEDYCEEVLSLQDKPIIDKMRAYNALIDAKLHLNLHRDALKLCLGSLKKGGCRFSKRGFGSLGAMLVNLIRAKMFIRLWSKDTLDEMPILEDELKKAQMKLLDKLASICYMDNNPLLPSVIFRSLNWSLKYGASEYTPPAFAAVGLLLATLGDYHGSAVYAQHGIDLLDRIPNSKSVESRTLFVAHTFVLHWTRPLSSSLKPLLIAYESGLKVGDTESATFAIWNYISSSFYMGKPMDLLERDCRVYFAQMKHLKRENSAFLLGCLWQIMLNLLGRSGNTLHLVGEVMDEDEMDRDPAINTFHEESLGAYRFLIRSYFGEYSWCARHAFARRNELIRVNLGHFSDVSDAFHRALALLATARATGSKVYKIEGKRVAARIKRLAQKGRNPNVKHYDAILDAEVATVNRKKAVAKKCYEQAVILSARAGFNQDAALASERFSLFLSRDMKDEQEAAFRMQESIKYYRTWGAHKKADMLEQNKLDG